MADEKKSAKPAAKPPIATVGMKDSDAIEQIIMLLATMIILGAIATAFLNYLNSLRLGAATGYIGTLQEYFLLHIWPKWKMVALLLSTAGVVGVVYNLRKINAIAADERLIFEPVDAAEIAGEEHVLKARKNEKWEHVLKLESSANESDWRLAILEADIILDEALRLLGYPGDTVGDMLKAVDRDVFHSLDAAWDAHTVRNNIAHGGTNFQLNERETKRVIGLFEHVFTELEII